MKKIICTIICVLLVLTLLPINAVASQFTDLDFSNLPYEEAIQYRDAINYVSDNHIMNGTSPTEFSPDAFVTRGMAVTALFVMSGDNGTYSNPFEDVTTNKYYYNAVGWAYANGIVSGTSQTTFSPSITVVKQQFITMLYHYAGYLGLERIIDESITEASDYTSVSSWARTPISWAYSYGILTRNSTADAISPTESIDRKNMALMISRFRTHAEGINFQRDTFVFSNSANNFVSGGSNYLMSQEDWDLLYEVGSNEGLTKNIDYIKAESWEGSCYGMAIATALDYIGKIDFNGNFCNSTSTMHDIPTLTQINNPKHQTTTDFQHPNVTITNAESKINLYEQSWYIKPIQEWASYIDKNIGLRALVAGQRYGGIGVFTYTFSSGGHAVIVYGKPQTISNGYRISVYDNRYPSTQKYIEINTSGNSWTGKFVKNSSQYETIKNCRYENNFDAYERLDTDGYYNSAPNDLLLEDYCLLQVCATGDFSIENEESELLTCTDNEISGEIAVYYQIFLPCGENAPVKYCFVVPTSDSFTCTVENGEGIEYFFVSSDAGTDGISAHNYNNQTIHCVTVSNISIEPNAYIVQ